jgi:hypothetical protein
MVYSARLSHPECEFKVLDALKVGQLNRTVDAIWLAYVVLHIPRQQLPSLVATLHQVLNPKGLLCYVTSVSDETVESRSAIAGLKDDEGNNVSVYSVRWNVDELQQIFSGSFEEVWGRLDVGSPTGRQSMSSLMMKVDRLIP